jgi:ectoine hydroxylase-related dioxygenase (phytanoyl-CoA dioxygenase family)
LPIIEEIVGGEVRLEEHQFIVNYPDPKLSQQTQKPVSLREEGWHRGIGPSFGSFQSNGHSHCLFTKALIYLTDNGPGEGTWVVPGSHKLELPTKQVVEFLDETLVRQLQAQIGDVLILSETLIHAAPSLTTTSAPRYTLIYGYTAPFMQTWNRYDPPAELLSRVTPQQRAFLTGELRYAFRSGQF